MNTPTVEPVFRAFGDTNRRNLLRLLAEAPLTVGELAELLRLPQSTVSRHVKALRETGLLVERREGNRVILGLVDAAGNGHDLPGLLLGWLHEQPLPPRLRTRLRAALRAREGLGDAFDRLAGQWDELRQDYFGARFHLEALVALLPAGWHVLDVGTGTGYLLPTLGRHFERVTAVDPSPAMLGLAHERAEREALSNVAFEAGSLEALPLPNDDVDAALAILVLHHATDMRRALAELFRVLKPGGRLLLVELTPHTLTQFQQAMNDPTAGLPGGRVATRLEQAGFRVLVRRPLPILDEPRKPAPDLYLMTAEKPAA